MRSAAEKALLSPAAMRVLAAVAGRPGAPRVPRPVRAEGRIVRSLIQRGLLRHDGDLYALTDEGFRTVRPDETE